MPGAAPKRHELNHLTAAPNKEMGAYLQAPNPVEVLVRIPVELIQEQLLNLCSAKLTWRQTDAVHYDQFQITIIRPLILIWRRALARLAEQSTVRIDNVAAC